MKRQLTAAVTAGLAALGCASRSVPAESAPKASIAEPTAPSPVAPVASSAPPAPVASQAPPAASEGPDGDLGLALGGQARMERMENEYRHPPAAVTQELEASEKEYEELPPLRRLPDFLSVDTLVALVPEGESGYVRERIHTQLEGGAEQGLLGKYLDDEERLLVVWLAGNLTQVLAVYDGKRMTAKRVIERGQPKLGDVLSETDGSRPEILVQRIDSMSVCCHPLVLDVWRIDKHGALSQALSFPRGHAEVGPGVRWSFLNHFEFDNDRVVVTRVYPDDGKRYELVYDRGLRRYRPTTATAKLLVEEKRAPADP